jgi:hypothetical protein
MSTLRHASMALTALLLAACGPGERPHADSDAARAPASAPAPARTLTDSTVVQDLPGWNAFQRGLPRQPDSAAAALERYRQTNGVPLDFYVRKGLPQSIVHRLTTREDDMSCGPPTAMVFVKRMPVSNALIETSEVSEIDSAGRELRRWPLPNDVDYWEIVEGVRGDELVTRFQPQGLDGVYLRVRPDGEFRVSAEPPQRFPPEQWLEVQDSVFLRVEPKDETPFYTYSSGVRPGPVGTWEPSGDSGRYVRTDPGPDSGRVVRATPRPGSSARMLACPSGPELEGMICRGFLDGARERRIAMPIPCS